MTPISVSIALKKIFLYRLAANRIKRVSAELICCEQGFGITITTLNQGKLNLV